MSEGGGVGRGRGGGEQSDPGPREGWTVKLLPSSWAPPLPIPPHAVSEILKIRICLHCRLRKLQGEKLFEPFLFLILIHQEGGEKSPRPLLFGVRVSRSHINNLPSRRLPSPRPRGICTGGIRRRPRYVQGRIVDKCSEPASRAPPPPPSRPLSSFLSVSLQ